LPDGSIIRIEKAGFTTNQEQIELGGRLEKWKKILLTFWQSKVLKKPATSGSGSGWGMSANIRTNEPALYIYISRRAPANDYRNVDAGGAQLIDADGCVYGATQAGGSDDGRLSKSAPPAMGGIRYSVGWFRFEAFPRRQKMFRFRVYDAPPPYDYAHPGTNFVEIAIANPAPITKTTEWSSEPLPITRSQDKVSFVLANAFVTKMSGSIGPNAGEASLWTDYQVIEDGQPSANWRVVYRELYDATGNFITSPEYSEGYSLDALSFREPAWKLRVKFFGNENSRVASNAIWTVTNLSVPGPGKFILINQSNTLQRVPIRFGSFGGPGSFTYSNAITVHAEPLGKRVENDFANLIAWPSTFSLKTHTPHLAIEIGNLSADQRLTVRSVDDQGRAVYGHKVNDWAYSWEPGHKPSAVHYIDSWFDTERGFVLLDLPADAKTVDLTFCIHTGRTAEFTFKPPQSKP
jgi:hypothetical protein